MNHAYFGPAFMIGHCNSFSVSSGPGERSHADTLPILTLLGLQNSVTVPYSMLMWLKKSTTGRRVAGVRGVKSQRPARYDEPHKRTMHRYPLVGVLAFGKHDGVA
jgi:hypothetical protein